MQRDMILKELSKRKDELESIFRVESLSLFGSVVRNEAVTESDLDILVTFASTPGLFTFLELKEYLENVFKCSVDLVTKNALKPQLRDQIIGESIYAF